MAIDVETLEESFDLVAPQGDELMRIFYDKLFEAAPSVQPLFAQVDMERQRQALLNMLLVLRESLRDLDDIVPDLEELGARHVEYGAQPGHYPVVGEVLIGAMAQVAGDGWKPEYTAAWQEAYQVVQDVMVSGASARAG
jgi:hemoglobin-like flavoprotein